MGCLRNWLQREERSGSVQYQSRRVFPAECKGLRKIFMLITDSSATT